MKARVRKLVNCGHVRWVVDLRCFDAGRKYFETEDDAKTYWDEKAKEVRNLGVSALSISHEDRVQLLVAQDKLKPGGASLIEAVEFFLKFKAALQKRTVGEAYNEFIASKQASGKRARYIRALGYSVGKFADVFQKEDCAGKLPVNPTFNRGRTFLFYRLPARRIHEAVCSPVLGDPTIAHAADAPDVLLIMKAEKYLPSYGDPFICDRAQIKHYPHSRHRYSSRLHGPCTEISGERVCPS